MQRLGFLIVLAVGVDEVVVQVLQELELGEEFGLGSQVHKTLPLDLGDQPHYSPPVVLVDLLHVG